MLYIKNKRVNNRLILISLLICFLIKVTVSTSIYCSVNDEIQPCTCRKDDSSRTIFINCEKMQSFRQIIDALQMKNANNVNGNLASPRIFPYVDNPIALVISYSQLEDLDEHAFQELKLMSITNLKLIHNNIRDISGHTFMGLNRVEYLSLADNSLTRVPREILARVSALKSLDIGRGKINHINKNDFMNSPNLQFLILPGNAISSLDREAFPKTLRHLHLGRNHISDLNGTLKHMYDLEWLFINANQLESLDDQLPTDIRNNKLLLIHASDNYLRRLPKEFKNLNRIESLFFEYNLLERLDGTLAKAKRLQRLVLSHNQLNYLSPEDFTESESLEDLQLGFNNLASLNGSLHPLRSLKTVNLTNNQLTEFSLQEIRGLRRLCIVDLSHNNIRRLYGRMQNSVELDIHVTELRLEHNQLFSLDGSLSGLHGLIFLNLSHNHISRIGKDDLIGLEKLYTLDFSNNHLTTLDETSKTVLPSLDRLYVSHNQLTVLERDFYGLPKLCTADLSYNKIRTISRDVVAHTKCTQYGSPAPLNIMLQDNPVLCDTALPELISDLEVNNTRLSGATDCEILEQDNIIIESAPDQPSLSTPYKSTSPEPSTVPKIEIEVPVDIPNIIPLEKEQVNDIHIEMNKLDLPNSGEDLRKLPINNDDIRKIQIMPDEITIITKTDPEKEMQEEISIISKKEPGDTSTSNPLNMKYQIATAEVDERKPEIASPKINLLEMIDPTLLGKKLASSTETPKNIIRTD